MFRVIDWDPAVAMAEKHYGQCDYQAAAIRVDTSHGPRQAAETLFHECLHATFEVGAIHQTAGGRRDAYTEEHIVSHVASWTMTLLGDNPQLRDFLAWAASQED